MKLNIRLGVLGAGLALVGCVVTSVYPFYTEKDLTFEPALAGTWNSVKLDEKEVWSFEKSGEKEYKFVMTESDKTNTLSAHLFELKGQRFLDFQLYEPAGDWSPVLPHYLLRVDQTEPTLKTSYLDYEWLAKVLEKKPSALRHVMEPMDRNKPDQKMAVLTADTAELQAFVAKNLKTEGAFKSYTEMKKAEVKSNP